MLQPIHSLSHLFVYSLVYNLLTYLLVLRANCSEFAITAVFEEIQASEEQ